MSNIEEYDPLLSNKSMDSLESKERSENIPISVEDKRKVDDNSAFSIEKFLNDLNYLIGRVKEKQLFDLDGYGKYFKFATHESDTLTEALEKARAIKVEIAVGQTDKLLNPEAVSGLARRLQERIKFTNVKLQIVTSESTARELTFVFKPDGAFYTVNGIKDIDSSRQSNEGINQLPESE